MFDLNYDPLKDSASSGSEVTDLNPERIYDTDLRRLDEDQAGIARSLNDKQSNVAKYMRAARSAGKYRQKMEIDYPLGPGGDVPGYFDGDRFGRGGGTNYAEKPKRFSGKPYG